MYVCFCTGYQCTVTTRLRLGSTHAGSISLAYLNRCCLYTPLKSKSNTTIIEQKNIYLDTHFRFKENITDAILQCIKPTNLAVALKQVDLACSVLD